MVQLAAETGSKEVKLQDVKRYCPSISIDFWICMNKTLQGKFKQKKNNLINFDYRHDSSIVLFKKKKKLLIKILNDFYHV